MRFPYHLKKSHLVMEDQMDQNSPLQPPADKQSSPEVKAKFVEPELTELGNLRDMTGLSFSPPPGPGGPI